jgi:hypothetical protein
MDYGFAPGVTAQDGRVRTLFARRAGTTVISGKRLLTLKSFVNHLLTSASVTRPIDNALLGAHANSEGQLFMPMFPKQKGPTTFEILEDTLATASHSVAIDDTVIGHTAGDPLVHSVHFKGCNIGKAVPFVTKLKEALGDHVILTAPKHFHGITPAPVQGSFEYMAYEFSVRSPKDFATRALLLAAFDTAGFQYIDGTPVPTADWAPLVPRRIGKRVESQVTAKLGTSIGKRKTILVPRQFRVDRLPFTYTINYTGGPVPPKARWRPDFEAAIATDANFQSSHAFPFYERLGYADATDFIAGYTWTFSRASKTSSTVICRGTRSEYTIVLVITDRTTGDLIFNFHPKGGSGFTALTTALQESDATFFQTV